MGPSGPGLAAIFESQANQSIVTIMRTTAQKKWRTERGWWPTTACVFALLLALVLGSGVTAAASSGAQAVQPAFTTSTDIPGKSSLDMGFTCQTHCGCHQAARLDGEIKPPVRAAKQLTFAATVAVARSVAPDLLPRPPRE